MWGKRVRIFKSHLYNVCEVRSYKLSLFLFSARLSEPEISRGRISLEVSQQTRLKLEADIKQEPHQEPAEETHSRVRRKREFRCFAGNWTFVLHFRSSYKEAGLERIVDQVVNPKIMSVIEPEVEGVIYSYLGVEKPAKEEEEEDKEQVQGTEQETLPPPPPPPLPPMAAPPPPMPETYEMPTGDL